MSAPSPPFPYVHGGEMSSPPLPPGWTEHRAPTGQSYYFHTTTGQSTYTRPMPPFPLAPQYSQLPPSAMTSQVAKKDKPLYKIPIPDTPWLRVKTTQGNIFYTHTERKQSVWTVPEEINDAVTGMDWVALEEDFARQKEEKSREKETARIAAELEMENVNKRKAPDDEADKLSDDAPSKTRKKKRRADALLPKEDQAIEEMLVEEKNAKEGSEDEDDDGEDEESEAAFSNSEAEEAWQREMAEDMAALAATESAGIEPQPKVDDQPHEVALSENAENEGSPSTFTVPAQVNLSSEEAKALFKTLLNEKNPSPLAPFASVMPALITDPRYVLLPSQSDRESAFNEWCRDISRAARLANANPSVSLNLHSQPLSYDGEAPKTEILSKEDEKRRTREAYDALLKSEVSSTRTTWDEFRRKWKKDRRFFAFGRDDRERERVFRSWLKDLGERKRAQARKAELDFMELLKSNATPLGITQNSIWAEVKKLLVKDPRYDAVGSSTMREELFGTFLKALSSKDTSNHPIQDSREPAEADSTNASADRKTRAERALREREERMRRQKTKVEKDISVSRAALGTAEAEQDLMSFYVDAVRDPLASYHELQSTFAKHPRFASSTLPSAQKEHLFARHTSHLANKHRASLHALFLHHAPLLSARFDSLPETSRSSLETSLPAAKLGLHVDDGRLGSAFKDWMEERTREAREDFQKLLEENSFVEFWGKVKKIESSKDGNIVPGEEDDSAPEDGEEGGGKADLKTLAKAIGTEEVERVLKNDQRYRAFDHIPEERLRWIKNYLSALSAPKLSVHVSS